VISGCGAWRPPVWRRVSKLRPLEIAGGPGGWREPIRTEFARVKPTAYAPGRVVMAFLFNGALQRPGVLSGPGVVPEVESAQLREECPL